MWYVFVFFYCFLCEVFVVLGLVVGGLVELWCCFC